MSKVVVLAIIISVVSGSVIGLSLSYVTLQPSIDNLQEAYVSASLKDDKLSNPYTHNVLGTVINFGSETASNIIITVKWYKLGASFHQEIITLDSLAGRAMKDLSFSYTFGGSADDLQYTITWT